MGARACIFFLSFSLCTDFSPSLSLPISLSVFSLKDLGIRVLRSLKSQAWVLIRVSRHVTHFSWANPGSPAHLYWAYYFFL